jgi:hypothetical protein
VWCDELHGAIAVVQGLSVRLLAIDPGTRGNLGYAFFNPALSFNGIGLDPMLACARDGLTLVIEHPEIYRSRHMKGDPNLIAKLIKQVGWIEGHLSAYGKIAIAEYLPKQWKGQIDKEECARRAWRALTPTERDLTIGATLDTWDAIALGLYHLKRFTPHNTRGNPL